MRLKSLTSHPANGFKFFQAETNWHAPDWMSFPDLVAEVIKHRRANPRFNLATDRATVEHEVEQQNVARLLSMKNGRQFLLDDGAAPPPVFPDRPQRLAALGAVTEGVKRYVVGAATMKSWFGAGMQPVAKEQAEHRAAICVACPQNVPKTASEILGEGMLKTIQAMNSLKLETSQGDKLKACGVCLCWNPLKVFVPLKHIVDNEDPAILASMPQNCWVPQEMARVSS